MATVFARIRERFEPNVPDPIVVRYGETKSSSFMKSGQIGNFKLPESFDQKDLRVSLKLAIGWFLPEPSNEEYDRVAGLFALLDETILAGLQDPINWVLPKDFVESPGVQELLEGGNSIESVLDLLLTAARVYLWMYQGYEWPSDFIPHLLELESAFLEVKKALKPPPKV